jgi:hypothetical protein
MERKNIPVNHRTIAKKWYSFGFPRGGRFRYFLDASTLADAEMETYLPAPAVNTRLTFVCIDATKPVTINSSSKAPLEGSTTRTVTLTQFQALDLVSNAAGTEWLQHRHGDKIIL